MLLLVPQGTYKLLYAVFVWLRVLRVNVLLNPYRTNVENRVSS